MASTGTKLGAIALVATMGAVASAAVAFGHGRGFGGHGMMGHGAKHWIKKADANKDGVIELKEIEQLRQNRFDRFDADKNGSVTPEEIEKVVRARVERMSKRIVRRFDADRNGTITKEEFNRFAKERFTWMDLNDDGKITGEEMPGLLHGRGAR